MTVTRKYVEVVGFSSAPGFIGNLKCNGSWATLFQPACFGCFMRVLQAFDPRGGVLYGTFSRLVVFSTFVVTLHCCTKIKPEVFCSGLKSTLNFGQQ